MNLHIALMAAILATLLQVVTVKGFALWSDNIKMCTNEYLDIFCTGTFLDTQSKKKVINYPVNRFKRDVVDECCQKHCTIRYIFDKFCANRTTTEKSVDYDDYVIDEPKNTIPKNMIITIPKATTTKPKSTTTTRQKKIPKKKRITTTPAGITTTEGQKFWWIYPVGVGPWTM